MGGCVVSVMDKQNDSSLEPKASIQRLNSYGPQSVAVPDSETATCSSIYLNGAHNTNEALKDWREKVTAGPTQALRFVSLCRERSEEVALAYRPVEKIAKESIKGANGQIKTLEVTHLKERETIRYGELLRHIESFSRGLAELGIAERSSVAIYEETRWEWLASIYGIWLRNLVATTVYANLGEDALFHALHEAECKAVICNGRSVPNLLRGIAAGSFPPCIIIYLDDLPAEGCESAEGVRVVSWKEVADLGAKANHHPITMPANNDDLALIMYTSGTVSGPKGVMHTYGSLKCGVQALNIYIESILGLPLSKEVYLSYLPLAHIMEFAVVNIFLCAGASVGFGSPRTLTDMTARPHGDFTEYRPMAMVGVPRIFDTIKKAVEAKLPPVGSFKRQVFDTAYQSRLKAIKQGKDTPFWNEKVFKIPREVMGGRMRAMLSGGGPVNEDTQEFINVVFGALVVGWGLTETVCVGGIQRLGDLERNCTGQVLQLEELQLLDTEEYKHTDNPEPRGEILLRGPFMFKGYYKNDTLTKEVLGKDGWFHTGDVGSVSAEGKVRIIGRIKALVKNSLGEYIALETLEAIYAANLLVMNNNVCILVHPNRNYICALVIPDPAKAKALAKEKGITGEYPEFLSNLDFIAAATASMQNTAVAAKRKPFETVKQVRFVADEWSPENGMMTAALKLKRRAVDERYKDIIDDLFVDNNASR